MANLPDRTVTAVRRKTEPFPVLWLFPVLFLVLLFTLYPVAHALWTSLHAAMVLLPVSRFVGLDNYASVLGSEYFWVATKNTVLFALVATPLILLIGLGVAKLLLARFPGRAVVRSVVFLPWALPGAVAAVLWIWVFHPSWGLLNLVLYELGVIDGYIPWLTDPVLVRLCVVVAHVWTQFPFAAVLLMAALSTIDPELYEAAELEGVTGWQSFRFVTFPQIGATLAILAIYEALIALTAYDLTYAMTGGGPGTATTLLSFHIWKESFSMLNFGNGSALAFIVVLISLVFIVAIMRALPSGVLAEAEHE